MGDATPIQAVYAVIGALALLPIYFGSFASLKVVNPSALPPLRLQSLELERENSLICVAPRVSSVETEASQGTERR